jgi:predicted ATPase
LERLLPVRSFSASLLRKISLAAKQRVNEDIEKAFAYILEIPGEVEISRIGSYINKIAHLIERVGDTYSSSNAASGEESLINVLTEIIETPKDSLILIDEIEAGLHPRVQRRLADIIQYISWRDKKQFILTTHSPSFLSALPQKSRVFIEYR